MVNYGWQYFGNPFGCQKIIMLGYFKKFSYILSNHAFSSKLICLFGVSPKCISGKLWWKTAKNGMSLCGAKKHNEKEKLEGWWHWKCMLNLGVIGYSSQKFCFLDSAIWLVVLVQTSSEPIKQVFSQLKDILETSQHNALQVH